MTQTTVERVQPVCTLIHAATPLLSNPCAAEDTARATTVEEKLDAHFVQDDNQVMRWESDEVGKCCGGEVMRREIDEVGK